MGSTSVAVVVLDTLRKDTFDERFDWLPGRRFERAFSTANWTIPAHASLFTGRYASEVGVHAGSLALDHDEPTLAERLAAAGYDTRAYSANPNVSGEFDFDRGFDTFEAPPQFRNLSVDGVVEWGEVVDRHQGPLQYLHALRECLRPEYDTMASLRDGLRVWLDSAPVNNVKGTAEAAEYVRGWSFSDPAFCFVNVMEAHEPYDAPDGYATVETPPLTEAVGDLDLDGVDRSNVSQAYGDCAGYLSDAYRDLFATLREEFEYVITLSDHGELLGEHDAWGHEHGVYPELIHVPLVVSGPGMDGRSERTVSLLDVHATVLDLAGIDGESRGRTLLAETKTTAGDGTAPSAVEADATERAVLAEYLGLTPWSHEKLVEDVSAATRRAYGEPLRGFAQAGFYGYETLNGVEHRGDPAVEDPKARLADLVADLDQTAVGRRDEVPESVRDQLEELGYA